MSEWLCQQLKIFIVTFLFLGAAQIQDSKEVGVDIWFTDLDTPAVTYSMTPFQKKVRTLYRHKWTECYNSLILFDLGSIEKGTNTI